MSSTLPQGNPMDRCRELLSTKGLEDPTIVVTQISENPPIFECKIWTSSFKESGLGKSQEDAEKAAYLALSHSLGTQTSEAVISPALSAAQSRAWADRPRNYLQALAVKYKKTLTVETEAFPGKFCTSIAFDKDLGLVASGQGSSKKDASHQAALYLCLLIDDYIAKNGAPLRRVHEYEKYLARDVARLESAHWYSKAREWVVRIASFTAMGAPTYSTVTAPLDPDTFLCTVSVDEEKGAVGYGRAAKENEAARLAAIDFCSRYDQLLAALPSQKIVSGAASNPQSEQDPEPRVVPEGPKTAVPVHEPVPIPDRFVVANPDDQRAKVSDSENGKRDLSASLGKAAGNFSESKAIDIVADGANNISKNDLPKVKAAKKNPKIPEMKTPESPSKTNAIKTAQSHDQGVERTERLDYLYDRFRVDQRMFKQLTAWLGDYKPTDFLYVTYAEHHPGQPPNWRCRFSITTPGGNALQATNANICSKKQDAVRSAFLRFMKVASINFKNRKPARPQVMETADVRSAAESSPSDNPSMVIGFPGLTIQSLDKWFSNPKNFGRLKAIAKMLETLDVSSPETPSPPKYNVSMALLDSKSNDLLQHRLTFLKSARGQEIISYQTSLPIFSYRDELLSAINGHQVVLVSAENGYGKSTQVANYILEQMTQEMTGAQCNIIVVCGSSLVARALSGCVVEERGEVIGQCVSFYDDSIEDRQRFGSITFCTGELLLQLVQGNPDLYGFSHVVVDNVDDGSLVNDILLFALSRVLDRRAELRLVMLSSLVEVGPYQTFFATRSFYALVMAPYNMQIRQFFLDDYLPLLDSTLVSSNDSEEFVQEELQYGKGPRRGSAASMKSSDHMPYSLVEAILGQLCRSTSSTEPILVFLPSGEEISTLHRLLTEDDILKVGYGEKTCFTFVCVHPNARSLDDAYRVDYRSPVRKIFLCTADAESTVSLTNIVHVIDTCKRRPELVEECPAEDHGTYCWISQVECVRRSRCAGRLTGVGSYYGLMSLQRFSNLVTEAVPDVHRYTLPYVISTVKRLVPTLHLEEVLPRLFHPIESKSTILDQVERLKMLKAMAPIDDLTVLGTLLNLLPIPVHLAKLVLYGLVFRCLDPVLVIAATCITGSPFVSPRPGDETNPYMAVRSDTSSDQVCTVEAFNRWWDLKSRAASRSAELEFCAEHRLSHAALVKIAQTKQRLAAVVTESGLIASMGRMFNRLLVGPESKDALMAFLNENQSRLKLAQALSLICQYPNLAVANAGQWRTVRFRGASHRMSGSTCAGRGIETTEANRLVAFMFHRLIPYQPSASISEVARASPLALALFFTPDTTAKPHPLDESYSPPFRAMHVDHQIHFSYSTPDAGNVTAHLKACLEIGIQWLFTRLAHPGATHTVKEFSEEEIVRYIDNVIRTTISLLESEKF